MCIGPHPYIPVTSTAKVELYYQEYGQRMENVFHVTRAGDWGPESLGDLYQHFHTWVSDYILPGMCTSVQFMGGKCTDLASEAGSVVEFSPNPAEYGEKTATFTAPLNVTVVGKWTTAGRGRSYRGRTYFCAVPVAFIAGNQLSADGISHYTSAMSALWSAITAMSNQLVVVSYCHNKSWRETGVHTQITGYSLDINLDSQRRRLTGRGK